MFDVNERRQKSTRNLHTCRRKSKTSEATSKRNSGHCRTKPKAPRAVSTSPIHGGTHSHQRRSCLHNKIQPDLLEDSHAASAGECTSTSKYHTLSSTIFLQQVDLRIAREKDPLFFTCLNDAVEIRPSEIIVAGCKPSSLRPPRVSYPN